MDFSDLTKVEARRDAFLASVVVLLAIAAMAFILFIYEYNLIETYFPPILLTFVGYIIAAVGLVLIIPFVHYKRLAVNGAELHRGTITASRKYIAMLSPLTNDKVTIPENLFIFNSDFRRLYYDSVNSYLYGFPNASLPNTVRCLEVGLKKKYNALKSNAATLPANDSNFVNNVDKAIRATKNKDLEEVSLLELIEAGKIYYADQKETAQYLRTLRNKIHDISNIVDSEAQFAIAKITSVLNGIYSLSKQIDIKVRCTQCGKIHTYNIDSQLFYIGNKIQLECKDTEKERTQQEKHYVITVLPSLTDIY